MFVDPEQYKLRKLRKENRNNNHNNLIQQKKKEKLCHGCRQKYVEDKWDEVNFCLFYCTKNAITNILYLAYSK